MFMDKKHILYFSAIGVPIGLLEVWEINLIITNLLWILLTLVTAYYLITRQRTSKFTEGFVIGFLSRGIATMIHPAYVYTIESTNIFSNYTDIVLIQSTICGLLVGIISFTLYRLNYFQSSDT
tara:strand:+ start:1034 stop:1402 length:369 start_codon:yes stop_codon:yes gene_type:complete